MPDHPNGFARPMGAGWIGWASRVSAALAAAGLMAYLPATAHSQTSSGPVSVDLSVIEDGGVSAFPLAPNQQVTGKLLVPPRRNPVSVLHVVPKGGPSAMPAKPQKRVVRTAPKPMPVETPEPAKAEVAASPPKKMEPAPPPPAKEPEPAPVAAVEAAPPAEMPKAPEPPAPAPEPAAAPEPKTVEAPASQQPSEQAALPPAAVDIKPGRATRIEFDTNETKLPENAKETLKRIADGLKDKSDLRLQLLAYAGAEGLTTSKARRMSLSRALSVRSFLIENGVRSTRIDVRALGTKTDEQPLNRVDVDIAQR